MLVSVTEYIKILDWAEGRFVTAIANV